MDLARGTSFDNMSGLFFGNTKLTPQGSSVLMIGYMGSLGLCDGSGLGYLGSQKGVSLGGCGLVSNVIA